MESGNFGFEHEFGTFRTSTGLQKVQIVNNHKKNHKEKSQGWSFCDIAVLVIFLWLSWGWSFCEIAILVIFLWLFWRWSFCEIAVSCDFLVIFWRCSFCEIVISCDFLVIFWIWSFCEIEAKKSQENHKDSSCDFLE